MRIGVAPPLVATSATCQSAATLVPTAVAAARSQLCTYWVHGNYHHGCPFCIPGGNGETLSSASTPTRFPSPSNRVSSLLGNVPLSVSPVCTTDADHASRREPCNDERHFAQPCPRIVSFSGSFRTPFRCVRSYSGALVTTRGGPRFVGLPLWRHATIGGTRGL